MLFNSPEYLIFLALVFVVYFSIPNRFRWILLLTASTYFYASWNAKYVFLIAFSIIIDYFSAILIEKSESRKKKFAYLLISLVANLGLLFFFKYFNFFTESFSYISNFISMPMDPILLRFILPVGISFYTFQTLSYTIDVYRGSMKAERHLGIFATYVLFFPQLVAGPIERATNLLPQFYISQSIDWRRVVSGIQIMLFGFFMKVVVADRLAGVVDLVYNNLADYSGATIALATYMFSFQIYGDFAGYSFIAIGSAKIFGISLMDNFRQPYLAASIREFWRRWHISLSTWIRDYLYLPLGGDRLGAKKMYRNLLIVFILSGLWHGAGWNFIIWGAIHGLAMVIYHLTKPWQKTLSSKIGLHRIPTISSVLSIILTFNIVTFAFIFFRANNVLDTKVILDKLWTFGFSGAEILKVFGGVEEFILTMALLFILLTIDYLNFFKKFSFFNLLGRIGNTDTKRWVYVGGSILAIVFFILIFGVYNSKPFIYFQF